MGSPEEAKSSSSKPSLLSTSTSADSANVQSSRILSGLESSGRINQSVARPKKRRNWSLGIGAIAIVIAGIAAFFIFDDSTEPTQAARPSNQLATATTATVNPKNIPATIAELAPVANSASTAQTNQASEQETGKISGLAALIVNDNGEQSKANSLDSMLAATATGTAVVSATKNKSALSDEKKKKSSASTKILASNDKQEKSKSVDKAKKIATSTTSASSDKVKSSTRSSSQAADSDVALIAAIVAHDKALPVPASDNSKASSDKIKVDERSRDIVERKPGDTTESLLQRCKNLGSLEGGLCRSRICAGRWSSDAACAPFGNAAKVSEAN